MKKIFYLLAIFYFFYPLSLNSQWQTSGGNIYYNNGGVGIGITPYTIFHVYQPQQLGAQKGDYTEMSRFSARCGSNILNNSFWLLRDSSGSEWWTTRLHNGVSIDDSFFTPGVDTKTWWERDPLDDIQSWGTKNNHYLTINQGNIGIGTVTPDYKLDVVGTIRAHQVIVNTQKGADFVFEDTYNLRSLEEVEQFISQNKHLPNIAPASTMVQEGVDMGKLQILLLQKVEELTLYTIEQNKQIKELKEEVNHLKNKTSH